MLSKDDKDFFVGLSVFFIVASILYFIFNITLLPTFAIALPIAISSAFIYDKLSPDVK